MRDYAYAIDEIMKAGYELRMYRDDQGVYFVSALRGETTTGTCTKSWRGALRKLRKKLKT